MPLAIASKDANGNDGVVCGKACYPGQGCSIGYASQEVCIDLVNTVYEEGGIPVHPLPTGLCPEMMDCLASYRDPYGLPYEMPAGISMQLAPDEDGYVTLLKIYENGVEVEPGWSAAEGTPCYWVRFYGL